MLNKSKPMKARLPAIVVPDEMRQQLNQISKSEGVTLSETIRQGLAFFLHEYVNNLNHEDRKGDNA